MANRIYNYAAFYVEEPFMATNLGANIAPDFCFYNMLRMWKGQNPSFPFKDAHETTYNVRDDSNWEETLKPRLHERLRNSRNIILFLSSVTKNSRALHEEIDYGINILRLPIIVVYPEYGEVGEIIRNRDFKAEIESLWDKLPILRDNMHKIPTLHVPLNEGLISRALRDPCFTVQGKTTSGLWFYPEETL